MTRRTPAILLALLMGAVSGGISFAAGAPAADVDSRLAELLDGIEPDRVPTGILYDRVLPLSRIDEHDGSPAAGPASLPAFRQMYHEITRAALRAPAWPALPAVLDRARGEVRRGVIPIAFMNFRYNRIRPEALQDGSLRLEDGRLVAGEGNPFVERRVFAAAPIRERTFRGESVTFALDGELYFSNDAGSVARLEIDFGDGRGFRTVSFGERCVVHYDRPGTKIVSARMRMHDDTVLLGSFPFHVESLVTPSPHDTISVTASIPYGGQYGTGDAYVYLSGLHASLRRPVVVAEGFDLDNTMNWDELYNLLNQENLIENLRADGFDAVVLNFTEATDYIQRNAFVMVELIEQVKALIGDREVVVVGASMGGLAARMALAHMEMNGMDHQTRLFVSFDAPHGGANIPLGIQYWLDFFSDQSADAAYLLSRLDTPAARQMLVYHHTTPPGTTGESDPLRAGFLADLASLGDYPVDPRKVAVANGSGSQAGQGFAAGDQIIDYEYASILVVIRGNVWAVPDASSQVIFDGLIDPLFLPPEVMTVTVSGTKPYDNAPGGSRASMAQMDSTPAPYGDIVALHGSHCFIPTTSALALGTDDLFHDIAGDGSILDLTEFDAVYFPVDNQEHVSITSENAAWFLGEVRAGVTAVRAATARAAVELDQNVPNPFNPSTTIPFRLARGGHVRLSVHDVKGRRIATLIDDDLAAGAGRARWNGRDAKGKAVSSGVYFYRLETEGGVIAKKMILAK